MSKKEPAFFKKSGFGGLKIEFFDTTIAHFLDGLHVALSCSAERAWQDIELFALDLNQIKLDKNLGPKRY
jgi:hypothetical protein